MRCPKCEDAALRPQNPGPGGLKVAPWRCERCAGLWFEVDQLERIGASWSEPETFAAGAGADHRIGSCPHGHGILRRAPVQILDFYLDRCPTCHGVFFDAGEWRGLAEHRLLESLPEIWSDAWQRQRREDAQQEGYLSWAKEHFGPDLFALLSAAATALAGNPLRSQGLAFLRSQSAAGGDADEAGDGASPD